MDESFSFGATCCLVRSQKPQGPVWRPRSCCTVGCLTLGALKAQPQHVRAHGSREGLTVVSTLSYTGRSGRQRTLGPTDLAGQALKGP